MHAFSTHEVLGWQLTQCQVNISHLKHSCEPPALGHEGGGHEGEGDRREEGAGGKEERAGGR